jgi:hypothetical protein
MLAVKNSMKRRLARSPLLRIIAGRASRPARTSAGGGVTSSSSKNTQAAGIFWKNLKWRTLRMA